MQESAVEPQSKVSAKDFKGPRPSWCPGCGDYGVLSALTRALSELGYTPNEVVIVSGIGCSGNLPHFSSTYGFHVTHGRALPVATGIALANPNLKIIVVGGDGDGFGIGVGHFVHAARRNLNISYVVMDNQIYGLTLGQASPTSQMHHITLTTPEGVDEQRINPIALALGAGASFVSRGFSGQAAHLVDLIVKSIKHKGFALVDTISPCVTFNRLNTYDWYNERIYNLDEEEGYNHKDINSAFKRGLEWGTKIPIGVFYQNESQPPLEDLDRVLKRGKIPVDEPLTFKENNVDAESIYDEFR